jgi:hypothetical protein
MSVIERLSSLIARFRSRMGRRDDESDALDPDPAEEFLKIQRGMRRLSLASDRSGEILHAVSTRLDEVQQTLLNMNRPQQAALALDEARLLHVLDKIDRLAEVPNLPAAADALLHETKSILLTGARWQPIAVTGAKPEGADIRIAEFVGEKGANGHADVQIQRILEQGYRRADGTLLRPGVVIAAAVPRTHHIFS